jgi:type IV pilus assembly protein PilB
MTNFNIPIEIQQLVKAEQAYHYRIIPTERKGSNIILKTDAHDIASLQAELMIILGFSTQVEQESTENINLYLTTNYRKSSATSVSNIILMIS